MSKDRRLGRGLAALLGAPLDEAAPQDPMATSQTEEITAAAPQPSSEPDSTNGKRLLELNVYEIDDNPFQPRREFDEREIVSLAENLKTYDMLQPVLVRKVEDRYQLISGERRLRAAIHAGWTTVPAQLREADDRLVAELAIVENLQRKDLNPIEKALAFKRYLDQHGCTQEELAKRLKIDRSTIANLMRLLELPQEVLDCLRKGELSAGHARALLPLGDEQLQVEFSDRIRKEGLSVRNVEAAVQERLLAEDGELPLNLVDGSGSQKTSRKTRTSSGQIVSLEQDLKAALGTKVEIRQTSRGRGRIVIHFANSDEFERIRGQITSNPTEQSERKAG